MATRVLRALGAAVVCSIPACMAELPGDEPAPGVAQAEALASGEIVNGLQWADTAGNPIHAHGGGIVKVGAFYYWFGENRNPDFTFKSVNIYRSTDLRSWEFRGAALSSSAASELDRANNLFVDTDGAAYFISASNENLNLNLYRLTADYLGIASLVAVLFPGGQREAPVLFKRNGVYVLLTSGATGWAPNQARYATSTSLASGWSSLTSIGDGVAFHSQPTTVVAVQGTAGTSYLYAGDRWAGAWSGPYLDSMYVWLPLAFSSNTAMTLSGSSTVAVNAAAGTISGTNRSFAFAGKSSGKLLEVKGESTANNAVVDQFTGNGGAHQRWTLDYDGAGYFRVTNARSGKVLDVPSASTANGAQLIQFTSNNGNNQKWRVVDLGGGAVRIVNKHSGKVAEVFQASTADGAAIDQWTSGGGNHQIWQMTAQ